LAAFELRSPYGIVPTQLTWQTPCSSITQPHEHVVRGVQRVGVGFSRLPFATEELTANETGIRVLARQGDAAHVLGVEINAGSVDCVQVRTG
jgi:hypothetical protein